MLLSNSANPHYVSDVLPQPLWDHHSILTALDLGSEGLSRILECLGVCKKLFLSTPLFPPYVHEHFACVVCSPRTCPSSALYKLRCCNFRGEGGGGVLCLFFHIADIQPSLILYHSP